MIDVNSFLHEYELMGWIIERRWYPESREENDKFINKATEWERHMSHKIYKTEEIAKQAMSQSGLYMRKEEFRYRPLYSKKIKQ